jgi:hypothetical protein
VKPFYPSSETVLPIKRNRSTYQTQPAPLLPALKYASLSEEDRGGLRGGGVREREDATSSSAVASGDEIRNGSSRRM